MGSNRKRLDKMESLKFIAFGKNSNNKNECFTKTNFYFQTIPIVKETKTFEKWQRKL